MTEKEKLANTIEILKAAKDSDNHAPYALTTGAKLQINDELKQALDAMADINAHEEACKQPEKVYVVCSKTTTGRVFTGMAYLDYAKADFCGQEKHNDDPRYRYYIQDYFLPKKQNTEALEKLEDALSSIYCKSGCWFTQGGPYCDHYKMESHHNSSEEFKQFVRDVKAYIDEVKGK